MAGTRRFVGSVHIFQGPYKSNPTALYARKEGEEFVITPLVEPWAHIVGKGPTMNKAAGDFDVKWKAQPLPADQYTGPHWEEGIKAEKPPPPPKPPAPAAAAPAKDAAAPTPQANVDPAAPEPPAAGA